MLLHSVINLLSLDNNEFFYSGLVQESSAHPELACGSRIFEHGYSAA